MKTELKNWIENYNKDRTVGHITGKIVKLKDAPYASYIHLITKKNTLYITNGYVKDYQIDTSNFDGLIGIINCNSLSGMEIDENTEVFLCE